MVSFADIAASSRWLDLVHNRDVASGRPLVPDCSRQRLSGKTGNLRKSALVDNDDIIPGSSSVAQELLLPRRRFQSKFFF